MKNSEVIDWLVDIGRLCVVFEKELHFPQSYQQALQRAIRCVELMPELMGCIAMARDTCDACQYPNLAKEYERVINKAKELME